MNQWDDEDAADAAFSRLFAALPAVAPSPDFVQRTVNAAWEARAARRRWARMAIAASAAIVVLTFAALAIFGIPASLVPAAAQAAAASLMAVLWTATAVVEFWTLILRGGTAFARVAVMPQSVALMAAAWMLGGLALYSLQRLLRADVRFRSSGPLCI
jgi:hypothetical protein